MMTQTTEMECEYCGKPQGDRLTCCGEHHWVPVFDWLDWRKEDARWERITSQIDEAEDGKFDHLRQEEP